MAGTEERRGEPVPHERGVVSDDDSLRSRHLKGTRRRHAKGIGGARTRE
jgi:hypothetical protein